MNWHLIYYNNIYSILFYSNACHFKLEKTEWRPEVILSARNNISLPAQWGLNHSFHWLNCHRGLPIASSPPSRKLGAKNTITIQWIIHILFKALNLKAAGVLLRIAGALNKHQGCSEKRLNWMTLWLMLLALNTLKALIRSWEGALSFREQPVEGQTELIQTYHDTCSREFEPLIHPDNVTKLCKL